LPLSCEEGRRHFFYLHQTQDTQSPHTTGLRLSIPPDGAFKEFLLSLLEEVPSDELELLELPALFDLNLTVELDLHAGGLGVQSILEDDLCLFHGVVQVNRFFVALDNRGARPLVLLFRVSLLRLQFFQHELERQVRHGCHAASPGIITVLKDHGEFDRAP